MIERIAAIAQRLQDRLLGGGSVTRVVLALVVLVALGIALLQFPPNHDVAAILDLGARMLDGERLYVDIAEVNPPLIFLVAQAIELAARVTGLPDLWLAPLVALAWAALAIGLAGRQLLRALELPSPASRALLAAAVAVCTAGWAEHLGQREHIWFCATLPYLASLALRGRGDRPTEVEAIATGVMAALGFALKPTFLGVPVVGELWLLAMQRDPRILLRREMQVLLGAAVAYAAYVLLGTGYLDALRQWSTHYPAYDNPYALIWPASHPWYWGLGTLVVLALPLAPPWRPLRWLSLGMFAAWQGSAWVQHKGWEYHFAPLWMGTALLPALLVVGAGVRGTRWRFGPLVVLLGTLVGLGLAWSHTRASWGSQRTADVRMLASRLDEYSPGGTVLALTSDAFPTFPSVRMAGDHLVNRASTMLIPGMYAPETMRSVPFPYHPLDAMTPLERDTLTGLVDDLSRARPATIIVAIGTYKQGFGLTTFDWLDYMSLDPRWPGLLAHYQEVPGTPGFRMFLRADLVPPPSGAPGPHP